MTAADQQHPQYPKDRAIVTQLLQEPISDYGLVELGRLLVRYEGFPGARDIQTDLHKIMENWEQTRESLFAKTRTLHAQGNLYKNLGRNREDWS